MQKAILITGCSSGIGLVIATDLKQRGYRVIATCRKPADIETLQQKGFEVVKLDLDDSDSIKQAAEDVLALTGGKLYALFNNGGFGIYGRLNTITRRQFEQQFSTNLFGAHELTQHLLPAMIAQGEGRIIQTSSVMGIISTPGRGLYAASKYALEAWSDALRLELHGTGIQVSLIEPGPISTSFSQNVNQTQVDSPIHNPPVAKRFTLPPEVLIPVLHHALENPRAKIRYRVTMVTKLMAICKRLLPDRCMDMILRDKG
ncbi:SDR family oxidoreductase [Budvicia aquatica]|uniref:3-oxoacyl-[acyl-carrier-protein] reductase FabG n=1 Tax=Budvicia aquatica TaxID=82979 RepID=A0A2C6C180_9GAMM|nr:SDR family oxidoreductase [Budvicia aquatica]PHI30110.1 oxidoreductase [Budvicia aquatica]VFS49113.1 3-oxoacyl-[acyl-carrier-protein] reductase FabG [Budvicia aquatica]